MWSHQAELSNRRRVARRTEQTERFLRRHPEFIGYVGELVTAGVAHPGSKVGLTTSSALQTFYRHIFGTKRRKGCVRCRRYFDELKENSNRKAQPIKPGHYILATLPPLTPEARRLVEAIRKKLPYDIKAAKKSARHPRQLLQLEKVHPGLKLESIKRR